MQTYKFTDDGFHRLIRYRGIFDFDGFYKYLVNWIKKRDYDFYEKRIWDKPPYKIYSLEGRKKINYWIMYLILPEITLWDVKEVEIVKDGKVKKLTEARMKVLLNAGLILDYDGDFEKSPASKKMEDFLYNKVLYNEVFINHVDFLDYLIHDLMTDLKKYLEMETASNAY